MSTLNWQAHRVRAQGRLDPGVWAYLDGSAADGLTHEANQKAWQDIQLRPQVLRDMTGSDTRTRLLGRDCPAPILAAPMAALQLAHPDAEAALALACAAQGLGFVLSGLSSLPHAQVAGLTRDEAGRGPLWQQVHLHADTGLNAALADEAEDCGFEALVVTVDAPVQGVRDQQRSSGFRMPSNAIADRRHRPSAPTTRQGLCSGWAEQAATWHTLKHLLASTRLPVVVKGITHPADAQVAEQLGCQGIVVSNHGGRTLDTQPASAHLLPEVVAAVSPRLPVLVDGGIRRGTDVLKALALGASAVLVGRPLMYGLASEGAAGAAQVMRLLRDELEMAMLLCGCPHLSSVTLERLHRPSHPR